MVTAGELAQLRDTAEAGDIDEEFHSLRRAADAGCTKAMLPLSAICIAGWGPEGQDFAEALKWLLLASVSGNTKADPLLTELFHYVTDETTAEAERRAPRGARGGRVAGA